MNARRHSIRARTPIAGNMTMAVTPPTTANSPNMRARNSAGRRPIPLSALVKMPAKDNPSRTRVAMMAQRSCSTIGAVPNSANSTSAGMMTARHPTRDTSAPANGAPMAKARLAAPPTSWVSKPAFGIDANSRSICGRTSPGENKPSVVNMPQASKAALTVLPGITPASGSPMALVNHASLACESG